MIEKSKDPGWRLRGPAHAHLDAPCTDECYEPVPPPGTDYAREAEALSVRLAEKCGCRNALAHRGLAVAILEREDRRDAERAAALDAVLKAWNDRGPRPDVHAWAKRQINQSWPTLAAALDRLAQVHRDQ